MKSKFYRYLGLIMCAVLLLTAIPAITAFKADASKYGYEISEIVTDVKQDLYQINYSGSGEPTVTKGTYTEQQVSYTRRARTAPLTSGAAGNSRISTFAITKNESSYSFETFADLVELAKGSYSDYVEFIYTGDEDLVISADLTLPANANLWVSDGEVIVNEGVTFTTSSSGYNDYIDELTVKGTMNVRQFLQVGDDLTVTGTVNLYASIVLTGDAEVTGLDNVVDKSGWCEVYYHHFVETYAQMLEAFEDAAEDPNNLEHSIYVFATEDFSFTSDLTIPENVFLGLQGSRTYTIPSGKKVTANGVLFGYSDLVIAGTLVNNQELQISGWNWETDEIQNVKVTGSITGNGTIYINRQSGVDSYKDVITGLDFEKYEVTEYDWAWVLRDVTGLTKLSAPEDLTWHKSLVWDSENGEYTYETLKGAAAWLAGDIYESDYQQFKICIYCDNELVREFTYGYGNYLKEAGLYYTIDLTDEHDFVSGTYYFTVQAIAHTDDYRNSDVAKSPTWKYTKPSSKLTKPTALEWDWPDITWTGSSETPRYNGIVYYAATEEAEPSETGWFSTATPDMRVDWATDYNGKGYYYVKVRAMSKDITSVCHSSWSSLSDAFFYSGMEAPELSVSGDAATGKPKLEWDAVDNAVKYQIYRKTGKDGTYAHLKTTTGTSYIDKTAEAGVKYYYRMRAVDADGDKSQYCSGKARTCDLPRPVVDESNVTSTGKIKLVWDKIDGAVEYDIYRRVGKSGDYEFYKTTTSTSYTDKSTTAGTVYYYKVVAVHENTSANSAQSAGVGQTCKLAQPVVTASNTASTGKIKLKWDKVEGASKYCVYRWNSKTEEYDEIKSTTSTSYTDTTAVAGTKYTYRVTAVHSNSTANSAKSEKVKRTCDLAQPVVTASNTASTGLIKLKWATVEGASKYYVYRWNSKTEEYDKIGSTTSTSYTDTTAVAGTKYTYRVTAVHENSAANSAKSEKVKRTCDLARPDVSISLSSGNPKLTWNLVEGAEKYEVYRSTSEDGTYELTKTTTSLKYTDKSVTAGTAYYYKVKAIHSNSSANSAFSSIDSIVAE